MSKSNEEIIERIKNIQKNRAINGIVQGPESYLNSLFDDFLEALQSKDEQYRKEKIDLVLSLPEWDENKSDYENPYGEKIEVNSEWKDERLEELSEVDGEHEHIYRSSNLGWGQRKLKCLVCDGRDDD